jgi:FkbH-like protein
VRQQIPELQVPEVPPDPSLYATWVGSLPSLIVLQQTAEDARRTEQYRESRVREAYRSTSGSIEDFLRGLGLRAEVGLVADDTMARAVQLLAKTNQFNLSTRRHDEATLRRRAAAGEWRVYTMRVADRFGDFGLTGLAIAVPGRETWHIDSFLLSCRVIGKSVETALLARIAADARQAGASGLSADFVDSGRNQVASMFLANNGFSAGADGRWERPLSAAGPAWPAWIEAATPAGQDAAVESVAQR